MRLKSIVYLVILSIAVTACSQDTSPTNGEEKRDLHLSILNMPYEYYNYSYTDYALEHFSVKKTVTSNVLTLKGDFNNMISNFLNRYHISTTNKNYRSITFYGNNLDLNLDTSEFSGFSVVSHNENGFSMATYKIEANTVSEISNYTRSYGKYIFSEIFGYISHDINASNNSYVTILNSEDFKSNLTRRDGNEEDDPHGFDLAFLDQYPIILTASMSSGHFCTLLQCESEQRGFCEHVSESNPRPGCGKSSYVEDNWPCADDDSGENPGPNDPVEEIDYTFIQRAKSAMYDIRDNILSTTTKGQQYTDFYYKISYVWKVTGTTEKNKDELKQLMHFIRQKSILFITADNNVIMVNSSEAARLRALITKYKNVHQNAEYQFIFNTLSSDLDLLENKTKQEYLDYIQ